jgi:hypothetical protein
MKSVQQRACWHFKQGSCTRNPCNFSHDIPVGQSAVSSLRRPHIIVDKSVDYLVHLLATIANGTYIPQVLSALPEPLKAVPNVFVDCFAYSPKTEKNYVFGTLVGQNKAGFHEFVVVPSKELSLVKSNERAEIMAQGTSDFLAAAFEPSAQAIAKNSHEIQKEQVTNDLRAEAFLQVLTPEQRAKYEEHMDKHLNARILSVPSSESIKEDLTTATIVACNKAQDEARKRRLEENQKRRDNLRSILGKQ